MDETRSDASFQARRVLRLGMIGIGVGGAEILPAIESFPEIELVAGADINPTTRERFAARYPRARVYDSAEALCRDPQVEAVWIATPNRFHAQHTILAAHYGKHVVVEKPMALNLREAEAMVEAADRAGVRLMAGHTQSYSLPIRAMRRIIQSGVLGAVRAIHLLAYTDWMLRPRTPEELDVTQGGGVPYRQAPHQIDTVRFLGGGLLSSVRGAVGQWMPSRPIPGYYCAFMQFAEGTPATVVHNGYGYFLSNELVPWGESRQHYGPEERAAVRRAIVEGTRHEEQDKQALRLGGAEERVVLHRGHERAWLPQDLGVVVVSCERGDLRHSREGLYVYDDTGMHDVALTGLPGSRGVSRRAELEELYQGVVNERPIFHDGHWGLATLEACLALIDSARERREVALCHQIAVPPDYDQDLEVPYPVAR